MAVFKLPVVLLQRARAPTAVLFSPLKLLKSAAPPMAVFRLPTALKSVPAPTAVLSWPLLLLFSENHPTAVLLTPVVRLNRAFCPSAVVFPEKPPSGGGLTACDLCPASGSDSNVNNMGSNRAFIFIALQSRNALPARRDQMGG